MTMVGASVSIGTVIPTTSLALVYFALLELCFLPFASCSPLTTGKRYRDVDFWYLFAPVPFLPNTNLSQTKKSKRMKQEKEITNQPL